MKKLSKFPNKFNLHTGVQHCKGIVKSDSLNPATVSENIILINLKNNKVSKATFTQAICQFLKDGVKVLAKLIPDLCSRTITSVKFSGSCKMAKLKPIY